MQFTELSIKINKYLRRGLKDRDSHLRILSLLPLFICITLILSYYSALSETIPFWYTKPWGDGILAEKSRIFIIPTAALLYTSFSFILSYLSKKFYFTYMSRILLVSGAALNAFLLGIVIRIISIATPNTLFSETLSYSEWGYVGLGVLGFLTSYFILPRFVTWAFNKNLVTDPTKHQHPGMLLKKPSARGGGFIFSLMLIALSVIFLTKNTTTTAVLIAVFICGLIGLVDDFQNTQMKTRLRFIENPLVRLTLLLPIPVLIIMLFGVVPDYLNNPFDGNIYLTDLTLNILGYSFSPLPYIFTIIWTLAIMNMISWSNGVDGQFGGVAGIAFIILGLLALRLVDVEPSQVNTAKMAFIAGGLCFGFIPQTWHPSKIMWGFGAIAIGLLISAISIISRAKVATAIMIIMLPFLDGTITVIRRMLQRKNPLKGDRLHLHHLLLSKGLSIKGVVLFYWFFTTVFGIIGLLTAENFSAPVSIISAGLVGSGIILLNITVILKEKKQ